MSKVSIEGNASGTGTLTIAAPNTNTNYTLSLPTNTGTIITQNSTPAFASTIGVGGATAAASGAGITFPATASASSDANTLDDYEVGTWSPSAGSAGGSITTYTSSGRYVKIGDLVVLYGIINISNVGTASGTFFWGSAPFTSSTNSDNSGTFLVRENALAGTAYQGTVTSNSAGGVILTLTNNAITYTNGMTLTFTAVYQTA